MISLITSILGGGAIVAVVTAIAGATHKNSDLAVKTLKQAWEDDRKEAKEYRKSSEKYRERMEEKIDLLTVEVSNLKPLACYKKNCNLRQNESRNKKNSKEG